MPAPPSPPRPFFGPRRRVRPWIPLDGDLQGGGLPRTDPGVLPSWTLGVLGVRARTWGDVEAAWRAISGPACQPPEYLVRAVQPPKGEGGGGGTSGAANPLPWAREEVGGGGTIPANPSTVPCGGPRACGAGIPPRGTGNPQSPGRAPHIVMVVRARQIALGKGSREYSLFSRCVLISDRLPGHPRTPPLTGRGSLLSAGDIEPNPGPVAPSGPSEPSEGLPLVLRDQGLGEVFSMALCDIPGAWQGPSGTFPLVPPRDLWAVTCTICGWRTWTLFAQPLITHGRACLDDLLAHSVEDTADAALPNPDHASSGRGEVLLSHGDVESNPGPRPRRAARMTRTITGLEDYMLDPPMFQLVVQRLSPGREPERDAFATLATAQLPIFWTPGDDALRQDWHGSRPLWANPPFSLLTAVLYKLRQEGGHLLLIAPEWAPSLPALVALSSDTFLLPRTALFRVRGADLLPAPAWRTVAMLIHRPRPAEPAFSGFGLDTSPSPPPSQCLPAPFISARAWDKESFPFRRRTADRDVLLYAFGGRQFWRQGPRLWDVRGPSPLWCERCFTYQWPWSCPSLLPLVGPSLPRGPPPENTFRLAPGGVVGNESDPPLATTLIGGMVSAPARCSEKAPPCTGRGAALLTCGDVEANPGPQDDGSLMAVDVEAMVSALVADAALNPPPLPAGVTLVAAGDRASAFPPGALAPPGGTFLASSSASAPAPALTAPPPSAPPGPTAVTPAPAPPAAQSFVTPLGNPAPPLSPSWEEIAQDDRSTILHIPRGAVQAVTATFETLLSRYLREQSWEAFHALWAFPKAVLAPLSRGGKAHYSVLGRKVAARATAYLNRPVPESWSESCLPSVPPARRTRGQAAREEAAALDRVHSRVVRSVGNGALAKALNLLTSDGVQDPEDPTVLGTLQALHPSEAAPGYGPPEARQRLTTDVSDDGLKDRLTALRQAVYSFGKESAPGPSGLRSDHLKAMLQGPVGEGLLRTLDKFVQSCLQEGVPPGVAPILASARLTALRKVSFREGPTDAAGNATVIREEGTRPIAAGETLRRLVGKVLMRHGDVRRRLRALQPVQCGVGVPNACALVATSLQQWVAGLHASGNSEWGILQLDFRNAFTSVSRAQVLAATRKHCPEAVAWLESCYAAPSALYCGRTVLRSERGVQQGDPCGPAAFAWAVQDLAEDLGPQVGWQAWYLDDAHIVGTPLQLHHALRFVLDRAAAIGLDLNLSKCQLWGPAFSLDNNGRGSLPPGTPLDSALRQVFLVPYHPDTGLKALGLPVCHPAAGPSSAFARVIWGKRLQDARRKCEALALLPEAHVQLTLLRCCLDARKVNDLLRATPLGQASDVAASFSALLRDTLGFIIGTPVSDTQWAQATLPARYGGLGIQDPLVSRLAARMAGLTDFVTRAGDVLGLPADFPRIPADFQACLTQTLNHLGQRQPLTAWQQDPGLVKDAERLHVSQRWWSDLCARQRQIQLAGTLRGDDAIRFESQSQPHAMAWVSVIPAAGLRTLIPSTDFKCLLRWSLGIEQTPNATQLPSCPRCDGPMDSVGHHLVCCHRNGITRRHGAVLDYVLGLAHRAGFVARREQGGVDRTRPGDVLITRLDANGPCAVDITVRHTLAPSHPLRTPGGLGAWVERQEQEKKDKYTATCRSLGWSFVPFVVDCYGAVGREARGLMSSLLKMLLAQREGWERRGAEADAWQGLSVAVMREVGAQLRAARFLTSQDSGEDALPTSHTPYPC